MTKNHSPEYTGYIRSNIWYARSRKFQQATGNRCVLFPWRKSNHAHHLTYSNLQSERFIRDCVPLSKKAHEIIHYPILWKNKRTSIFCQRISEDDGNYCLAVCRSFWRKEVMLDWLFKPAQNVVNGCSREVKVTSSRGTARKLTQFMAICLWIQLMQSRAVSDSLPASESGETLEIKTSLMYIVRYKSVKLLVSLKTMLKWFSNLLGEK